MADTEQSQPASGTRKSRRKAAMKVREELANGIKDDDDKDNNKNDNKEAQKSDSPPRNTNSPDPNCAICLCRLENKSFTDSCFHMFCFVCLLEWSKIKAECPLCKQPFKSIIHNVRSYDDYDQYHLERAENPFSFEAPNGRRFRYRTTVTQDYMFGVRPSRHATHAPTMSTRTLTSTSEYRRRIYINGMHVVALRDACRRSRNIAPVFFSSNPAASHRLVPWLNRELNALLYNHEEHVQFVLQLIIDLIKRFPVQSEEFYQHVYPFIGRHTRHFMHEFEAFAKSPFCISSYDQRAVYEQLAESVSDTDSDPSDNGNDSDVMIVSTSTTAPDSSRRDPGVVRRHHLPSDLTPYSASLRDLLAEDDTGPAQSGWNSPIPGPSWNLMHLPSGSLTSLQLPGTSTQSRSGKQKTLSRLASRLGDPDDSDESEAEVVWSDSDSGDEVLCVGYDKPWQERTPVLVSTDSEEEKIAKRALKAKKDVIKKEDEVKKGKRRRSRSHSRHRRIRGSSSSLATTRRRSRSRSRNRHQRSRHANRSKSPTRHDRRRSPSPSGSRHRRHHRSVAYEDAFGYSRQTIRSERNSVDSRGSRHSEGRDRRKREHHQHSKHSLSSSQSRSRSPSKIGRRIRSKDSRSRWRSGTRSSSSEVVSRHKHKKSKKHKRSKDSEKEQRNSDNVQYKIVKDKKSEKKGDPLMSITIKRDKSEDIHVVSSTVDSNANANVEIEIPDNVVIRTEPVSPPSRSQRPAPSAEPGEILAEMISLESNTSSDKPRSPKPSKSSSSSGKHMDDSDSSAGTSEVRKKAFKKHPSGHKKTRRPLPRIPDPLPSTVSSCTPPQTMPVLDVMSQFFPNFGSPSTCTPPVSQDYPIPGMIANYFDSRHFYLCGFPGPCLPNFPVPPSQPSRTRVTSSDQAVVVSSSEDSDVVVEMVRNLSGHRVSSSVTDSGLNLDFLDRIPGISDSISDHRSIDVSEEIDVEDSESDTIGKSRSSSKAHVTEVFDSDDDNSTEHKSSSQSEELRGLNTVNSLQKSQSPSSTVQGTERALMDKEGSSPRVEHSSRPESPPSERITSTKDQGETSREADVDTGEATTDDSMDIDVGGPELCGQAIECCDESTSATCSSESDKSMEIDVVGSDNSRNESPMIVVNDATSGNDHEQQPILKMNQSELASSVLMSDYLQREQQSSHDEVSRDSNVKNNAVDCVRGIESTPASPCDANGCLQTPQSDCGHESGVQNTAVDLRTDSTNSDSKLKPATVEGGAVPIPLIEGASEISSEDEEEEASISKHPNQVIADVSDISSDESDYDDLSFPFDPMYSSTYPQVIDDDSASSDDADCPTRPVALQKTISISDVSSDEVNESESSRSGCSEHKPTASTPPTSNDSDSTAPPTGCVNKVRSSSADNASHSSGELSSGEISDGSSNGQRVYDDISSSENFDSSGESSPGQSSPRHPSSSNVPGQTWPQNDSLSEGEIVSD